MFAVYRTMERVLHTVSADGCQKRARMTRDVIVSGGGVTAMNVRLSSSCCNVDVMISLLYAYMTLSRH